MNMRKYLKLTILVTSIVLFQCATDQKTIQSTYISQEKCDAPVWNVGDFWRYRFDNKKEGEHRVLGIEEYKNIKIYIVQDVYGVYKKGFDVKTLQLTVEISSDGKKIVPMTDWSWHYDFPLYVGKKWEKMVTGYDAGHSLRDYLYTYRVISYENVTVPAGTFNAFKIEREQKSMRGIGDSVITYKWYSPEVKNEIKLQYGPVYGSWHISGGQGYELKSFKLAKVKITSKEVPLPKPTPPSTETLSHSMPPQGVGIVEKPQLTDGETWIFQTDKGKFIWEIEKIDDSWVILRQGEHRYYYDKELAFVKRVSKGKIAYEHTPPNKGALFFPLWAGKKWENEFTEKNFEKGTIYRFKEYVEIKDWENIETPAGVFKTLKIEINRENLDTQGRWHYTLWYSPEVKNYVKSASESLKDRNWVLAEFSLKKVETQIPETSAPSISKPVEVEEDKPIITEPQPPKKEQKKRTTPSPM